MNADMIRKMVLGQVPPAARKLVVAYAMQSALTAEMEQAALKAGATKAVLELAKGAMPTLLAMLESDQPAG